MQKNPVEEAMAILGGTPEDMAVVCRVSSAAVRKWLMKGRIRDGVYALAVAKATKAKGTEVPFERLLGLENGKLKGGPSGNFRCSSAERQRLAKLALARRHDAARSPVNALALAS